MAKYIKSLSTKKHLLNSNKTIFFADFETVMYNNKHYVTCYSLISVKNDQSVVDTSSCILDISEPKFNIELESSKLLKSFIEAIFDLSIQNRSSLVYFHNLGKFDGVFLVNYLITSGNFKIDIVTRNNVIYEITCQDNVNKKIKIRDTFLLFPYSLDKMSKIFCDDVKISYDHKSTIENYLNFEFKQKLLEYCKHDSILLAKSFIKFRQLIFDKFDIDITSCLTISSVAFKIFRSKYYLKNTIQQSHGHMDLFIRKSYRGGVVDVYRPKIATGYYYDVNSLYPYVMSNFDMPVGVGKFGNAAQECNFDINNFFGFIYVKVKCPDSLYIPFLTLNHSDHGLISPTGEWKDVYFSEEIKYALTLGYQFEYYVYYKFDKMNIFYNYVTDIYNERILNKDKKELSVILKLLLNSLYGRFGMKNAIYKNILTKESENLNNLKLLNLIYDFEKVTTFNDISTKTNLVKLNLIPNIEHIKMLYTNNIIDEALYNRLLQESSVKGNDLNIAVHIASAITAYARIYMHKLKMKYANHLYYSDTDSLITDIKIDNNLISETQIGCLRLEHTIEKGLFIAPKLYCIKTLQNDITKIKGVNLSLLENPLTYEDFLKLYEGECIKVNFLNTFLRNFKNYTIGKNFSKIEIKGAFNKREKLYKNGVWTNTKPLKINF